MKKYGRIYNWSAIADLIVFIELSTVFIGVMKNDLETVISLDPGAFCIIWSCLRCQLKMWPGELLNPERALGKPWKAAKAEKGWVCAPTDSGEGQCLPQCHLGWGFSTVHAWKFFSAQIRREQPREGGWSELSEMLREIWENIIIENNCIAFITLNHIYNGCGI